MSSTDSALKRRDNGQDAEDFIRKFYKARPSGRDEYDLETKHTLIEVKSCEAFCHNGCTGHNSGHHIGRFAIDKTNHCALLRAAADANKKAVYAFVVRIGKRKIHKLVPAEQFTFKEKTVFAHISWREVFDGQK